MRRVRFGGLWRHSDFLRLWAGQTVSQFGSQVTLLALPLVAVITLDASAFEVALLGTFDFLPFLLFALPAGVWVDRLPRRPILVLADAGRALVLGSIPVAAALGELAIWQLYAAGFLAGTLTVFFDVAYQSYLPSLVEREQLVEGNSKLEVSRSGAQLAGPGVAGLLIAAITAPYAIVVDALSFIGSAAFVARIRRGEQDRPQPAERESLKTELLDGLRFIFADPRWRSIAAYVASFNFFSSVAFSIFLVYAVRELGLSAQAIGLVFALANIGWLVGALVAGRVSGRLGIGRTLVVSGLFSCVPNVLIPLAPRAFPVPFLVGSQLLVALGIVLYNVTAISLIQALTPDRLLGRMNASRRFLVWGTIPLGNLAGGVLASAIGLRPTIFAGTIATAACFVFLLAPSLRRIERLPEPEAAEPAAPDLRRPLETQAADA